jgi:uncharacterized protein (DUF305 family)
MSQHHAEAIDIAKVGIRRSRHAELRQMARRVAVMQTEELATMRRLMRAVHIGTNPTMVAPTMSALSPPSSRQSVHSTAC